MTERSRENRISPRLYRRLVKPVDSKTVTDGFAGIGANLEYLLIERNKFGRRLQGGTPIGIDEVRQDTERNGAIDALSHVLNRLGQKNITSIAERRASRWQPPQD